MNDTALWYEMLYYVARFSIKPDPKPRKSLAAKKRLARHLVRKRQIALATPPWADRNEIALFYGRARNFSRQTGITHVVDHIIPITHWRVCGLHTPDNLQVIPHEENGRKHNHWGDYDSTADLPYKIRHRLFLRSAKTGAAKRIRTPDPRITNATDYSEQVP